MSAPRREIDDARFRALWAAGTPVKDIAVALMMPIGSVSYHARRLDLPRRPGYSGGGKPRAPMALPAPTIAVAPEAIDALVVQLRTPRADGECDGLSAIAIKTGLSAREVYERSVRLGCGPSERLTEHALRRIAAWLESGS